jgi:hypothetical protein
VKFIFCSVTVSGKKKQRGKPVGQAVPLQQQPKKFSAAQRNSVLPQNTVHCRQHAELLFFWNETERA